MHSSIIAQVFSEMGAYLPQRKFLLELMTTWPAVRGRFNYMNMSRYCCCHERTLRRWFSRGFAWDEFNAALLPRIIPSEHEVIAALDASFVPKSGRQTPGLAYFFSGCAKRALKGLEVSQLSVVDITGNTAYGLSAKQTMPPDGEATHRPKSAGKKAGGKKESSEETRVDAYLQHVAAERALLPAAVRHLAVDGYYASHKFVTGVGDLGLEVVGKLRCDSNLRYLYNGPQKERGRPRKYGDKVQWTNLDRRRWKNEGEVEPGVRLTSARVYHVSLKRIVRVALLQEEKPGASGSKTHSVLLYSTDLKLSARDIVRYYHARFQIEFLFRDAKGATGLNHCQARNATAIDFHWNAAFSALNLAKWEELQRPAAAAFSVASHKQRHSNANLLRVFSDRLGFDWMTIKCHPAYEELCNYGAISN